MRMKIAKNCRIAAALLLLSLLLTCLAGCKFGAPSDEEVRLILSEKLPVAKELLTVIYGEGIPLADGSTIDESWTTPHYYKVAEDFQYQSIADLKKAAAEVFSADYLEIVYEYAFEGTDDYMPRFAEDGGVLTMDVVKEPMGLLAEVYPDTATVISGSRYACKVEVECLSATGKTVKETVSLSRGEDGGWLFDSAVY